MSHVTLGIFRRNSGAGSSFSGMVFCCRQVRLLLVRSTSLAVKQPAVAVKPPIKPPKTIVFSTVSDVTLGIFPCNSGTCSSFSGMVFCCRQVLLVVFVLQWHGVLLSAGALVAGAVHE